MTKTDWIIYAVASLLIGLAVLVGFEHGQKSMRPQIVQLSLDLEQQRQINTILKYQADVQEGIILNGNGS